MHSNETDESSEPFYINRERIECTQELFMNTKQLEKVWEKSNSSFFKASLKNKSIKIKT